MQAGNQADAVSILKREVGASPQNEVAWRNLFLAQAQMAAWGEALATSQRMPKNVEARLETDPDYLCLLIQAIWRRAVSRMQTGRLNRRLRCRFPITAAIFHWTSSCSTPHCW